MPIFEYRCDDCGRRFERFVAGAPAVECPACESAAVWKLLSVFAVSSRRPAVPVPEPSGCGSCGDPRRPGACSREDA